MSLMKTIENKKRRSLFWQLQFVFWFSHWLIWAFLNPRTFSSPEVFIENILQYIFPFLLSLCLRFVYKRFNVQRMNLVPMIAIVTTLSVICGFLWVAQQQFLTFLFWGEIFIKTFSLNLFKSMFYVSYTFAAWSAIYLGFKVYEDYTVQKSNAEKSDTLAQRAQLEMLRYQLNPHFLFNSLSSLRALIRKKDNDTAEEMVTKISEFLKYSLLEGEDSKVPLSREIKTINHYFDIEKVRFGDQLIIEYNIDPLTEKYPIPVFLIHPLVENAVKHGMKTSPFPLRISIKTEILLSNLSIEIVNSGRWIELEAHDISTRTGLQNTKKRLELAYPNNHTFEIIKSDNSVFIRITININAN